MRGIAQQSKLVIYPSLKRVQVKQLPHLERVLFGLVKQRDKVGIKFPEDFQKLALPASLIPICPASSQLFFSWSLLTP